MKHLLLLPALLAATAASAQTTVRLGVRGGAHLARTTVDPASNYTNPSGNRETTKAAIYAWQAGIVSEINFGKLALQPALLFSQKGERRRATYTTNDVTSTYFYNEQEVSTNRTNWLEVPLNFVYTLHGNHGLQLLAGAYVALAIGGRRTGMGESRSSGIVGYYSYPIEERLSYGPGTGNRRFDAGLNFGLGYRQGPMQVQLSYGLGLVNLHSNGADYPSRVVYYDQYKAYNRVVQLTGTYFFKL